MGRVRVNPVPGKDALCRKAVGVQPGKGVPRLCREHPKGDVRARLVRNGFRVRTDEISRLVADEAEFHDEKDPCWSCGAHGQAVPGCEGYEEAAACSLCVVCPREQIGEGELIKSALTDAWGLRILVLRHALWELGFEGPPELGVPPLGNFAGSELQKGCLDRSTEAPPLLAQARATVARSPGRGSARKVAEPHARFLCGSQQQVYRRGKYGHTNLATIARPCPKRLESRERCDFDPASRGPLSTAGRGPEKVGSGSRRKGKVRAEARGCVETPRE